MKTTKSKAVKGEYIPANKKTLDDAVHEYVKKQRIEYPVYYTSPTKDEFEFVYKKTKYDYHSIIAVVVTLGTRVASDPKQIIAVDIPGFVIVSYPSSC